MNEIALGACPVIRPEGIYLDGHRVIGFGFRHGVLSSSGALGGDVGDLLSYRRMWDPFIAAHLDLWRVLNDRLERSAGAKNCPAGIFRADDIKNLGTYEQEFCAALLASRMYVSDTHPLGIRTQWNAWQGTSSADMVINAGTILEWHQSVVMKVGGAYKDELMRYAKHYELTIELPSVPEFSLQQSVLSTLETAFVTVKGVIGIVGYGYGESLKIAGNLTEAVAEGISETAKAIPDIPRAAASPFVIVGVVGVLALVGGALLIYYVPRRSRERA